MQLERLETHALWPSMCNMPPGSERLNRFEFFSMKDTSVCAPGMVTQILEALPRQVSSD